MRIGILRYSPVAAGSSPIRFLRFSSPRWSGGLCLKKAKGPRPVFLPAQAYGKRFADSGRLRTIFRGILRQGDIRDNRII